MRLSPASDILPGYRVDPATSALVTLPWPANNAEKLALAESSLGPHIIDWAEGRTEEPGLIHYLTGQPWRFTPGQKRFLILWYAYSPDTGRWLYRSGVKRGAKGTGKDPFAAAMMNIEFVGPSQLIWDGRRYAGIRHRMPLVQVSANSEAQAKDTMRIANAMLSREARAFYQIDAGETMTKLKDGTGGRMEILTYSEASTEGDPATFIALNESHHMTGPGGHAIAAVARRNVGKSPAELQARLVEFTNAHRNGMDSVAEQSFIAWQKQLSAPAKVKRDILYDSIEADPRLRIHVPEELAAGIRQAYSDAPWADLERLADEALDARTSAGDTIRFYFNGLGAAEDAWVDPRKADGLMSEDAVLEDGEAIAVFADLSKSDDATGIMACRLADSAFFVLGVWQKPHGDRGKSWLAPREEVKATILEAVDRYKVSWLGIDPSPTRDDDGSEALYWQEMLDSLHQDLHRRLKVWATPGVGGNSVVFDMRMSVRGGRDRNEAFTKAAMLVADLIDTSDPASGKVPFAIEKHPALRIHMHNAKRRPNQWGFTLGKETRGSSKKVDLAVCLVGARLGRDRALNSGKVSTAPKRGRARGRARRAAVFA